jgi:hypothetical protein
MFTIPGSDVRLPAALLAPHATSQETGWRGRYWTLRLYGDFPAVRVWLPGFSGPRGRWFAIGDVILSRDDYKRTRSLLTNFTRVAFCTLRAGSIINVGYCSALGGHPGMGEQAELVSGPPPRMSSPNDLVWSNEYGHA